MACASGARRENGIPPARRGPASHWPSVQAFPEYGPERRGAPIRAYNRFDERPIRRHDTVTQPDVVIVLDASLPKDGKVAEGLEPGGHQLINSNRPVGRGDLHPGASSTAPASVNLVMLGALAAVLGEPPLETLDDAAAELSVRKADPRPSVPRRRLRGVPQA